MASEYSVEANEAFFMRAILKPNTDYSHKISFLLACAAVLLGFIGMSGWLFDSFSLRSFFFADTTMKINTALLVIVVGICIILQHLHWRKVAIVLLVAAGIFCTLILFEHILQVNLNIDEWWFEDKDAATLHEVPGRTSLISCVSLLLLIGVQLLALFRKYHVSQFIGFILLLFLYTVVMGYLFTLSGFYRQGVYSEIAFHTELSLLVLTMSLLLLQSSYGWMQLIMFFMSSRKGLLALAGYLMFAMPLLVGIYIFCINIEHMSPAAGVVMLVTLSLLINVPVAYIILYRVYKTDKTLRKTNEQLQIALLTGKLGTYHLDLATGSMICSAQCKANYGLTPDASFHFPDLIQVILPAYREGMQAKVNAAIEAKTTYETEYQINWPDGAKHWIQVSGKPDYDESGKPVAMVGITRNITEQKEMEAQKNAFIGVVSHELKTPLTSVKAYLQLLMMKTDSDAVAVNFIGKAQVQVDKMVSMIKSFLNVSRLESGVMQLDKTRFLMDKLLREVIQEHSFVQSSHQIVMHNCDPVMVVADREKIAQVILNLLGNAVKYSPNAKMAEVTCGMVDDAVQIGVTDKGIGVPAKEIPYLFDRFYRASAKDTHFISGFGIGLYLSAEIVRLHGGEIWVDSVPDVGSTFYFKFPVG